MHPVQLKLWLEWQRLLLQGWAQALSVDREAGHKRQKQWKASDRGASSYTLLIAVLRGVEGEYLLGSTYTSKKEKKLPLPIARDSCARSDVRRSALSIRRCRIRPISSRTRTSNKYTLRFYRRVRYFSCRSEKGRPLTTERIDLPQGTLDLLILRTVSLGPQHGWAISERVQQVSSDVLRIQQGSLYPALHRLERRGWIKAKWGTSDNNRRAKYYELTRSGQKQLEAEKDVWKKLTTAVAQVLGPA